MTISKKERAEWRKKAADSIESGKRNGGCFVFLFGEDVICLLDALEAAERERDVLAGYIVEITDACTYAAHFYAISEECADCDENKPYVPCWLEWARQQARGETKNA